MATMIRLTSSCRRPVLIVLIALFCLVAAQGIGSSLFARIGYLLFAVMGLALAWAWFGVGRVRLTRTLCTPRVAVGERISELITVGTTVPWSVVTFCDDSPIQQRHQGFVATVSRHPVQRRWDSIPRQRGYVGLGPSRLVVSDPFGLFCFERHFAPTHHVIVHPAILPTAPVLVGRSLEWGRQQSGRQQSPQATTIMGVREYRTGDARNRIHWRSTAKRGTPMVKEHTHEPSAQVWLVYDAQQSPNHVAINHERGIQIAATQAHQWLDAGHAVGLVAYGATPTVLPPARGVVQRMLILDALAMLVCDGTVPLAHVIPHIDWHGQRHITICVITTDSDLAWVQALWHTTPAQSERLAVILPAQEPVPLAMLHALYHAQSATPVVEK